MSQKIDFNETLKDLKGKVITQPTFDDDGEVNGKEDMNLGMVAIDCLMGLDEGDKNMKGTDKYKRHKLATRINASQEDEELLELKAEDIAKIKKLIGKRYTPRIVGPAYDLIENVSDEADSEDDEDL